MFCFREAMKRVDKQYLKIIEKDDKVIPDLSTHLVNFLLFFATVFLIEIKSSVLRSRHF